MLLTQSSVLQGNHGQEGAADMRQEIEDGVAAVGEMVVVAAPADRALEVERQAATL